MSRGDASLNLLFGQIGRRDTKRLLQLMSPHAQRYAACTDHELVGEFRELIGMPYLGRHAVANELSIRRMVGYELVDDDARMLALACELFTRRPPRSQTRGTRLYDQQVLAAIHLMRGSLVQMDTGEGKTFALMVAACALLRRYAKVYVVTANPYLASRDAAETSTFWSALGVRVGVALPWPYEVTGWPGWEATVVYTTAPALVGKTLSDDMALPRPADAVEFGAVLLDEADAVILDQCTPLHLTRTVARPGHTWALPCQIALQLGDEDIRQDADSLSLRALLTPRGQERVKELGRTADDPARLVLMREVELAYTAIRLAVPGHHYEIVDNRVVPLDENSGWPRGSTPEWTSPLEHHLGLAQMPRKQPIHVTDMLSTLTRFSHVAGTSGTIIDEALEYALVLGISTARIAPRTPRRDGLLSDTTVETPALAEASVIASVVYHCESRPVLVATSTTEQAQRLAQAIRAAAPPGVTVRFADGESIVQERLFETAGRAGSVIVSTRVAGRGVDIQLDDEARRNGGAVLVALGHASEARLDRQLLGRVGRGGDPYTAWFVNSLDDPVLRVASGYGAVRYMMRRALAGAAIEAKTIDKSVRRLQRVMRRRRLRLLASRVVWGQADMAVYDTLRTWRQRLQRGGSDGADGRVGDSFLAELASAYVALLLPGIGDEGLDGTRAGTIAERIAELTGRADLVPTLRVRLTGQPGRSAVGAVEAALRDELLAAVGANAARWRDLRDRVVRAVPVLLDLGFLAELRERVRRLADASGTEPELLATAHQPPPLPGGATVRGPMGQERRALYSAWLAGAVEVPALAPADGNGGPVADGALAGGGLVHVGALGEPRTVDSPGSPDDLAPVALVVGRLERAEGVATTDVLVHLSEAIVAAEARRSRAGDEVLAATRLYRSRRTSTKVASETISVATEAVLATRSRAVFDLANAHLSPLRYTQAYSAVMDDVRRISEAHLVESLCRNLLACREPAALDALFDQNRPVSRTGPTYTLAGEGPAPPVEYPLAEREFPSRREELILYFVDALRADRGEHAPDEADIIPALNALLDDSPLLTLTDGARVREAIERWRQHPIRRELAPWKRRKVDAHVKEFLAFLHDHGLAAPLPTGLKSKVGVLVHRARRRIANPRMGLALAAVTCGALVAGVAALVAVPVHLRTDSPWAVADGALALGSFEAGRALAAILAPATGAAMVMWLLRERHERGLPIEKALFGPIAAASALALAEPWHADSLTSAAGALVLAAALFSAAHVFKTCVWNVENLGQLRLLAGIVAVGAGAVAIPRLAGLIDGGARPVVATAVTAGVAYLVTGPWRRATLPVDSLHLVPGADDEFEVVPYVRHIAVDMGWAVHASAVAVAWASISLANRVVPFGDTRAAVELVAYAGVLTLWCLRLARGSCGVELWTAVLRKADEDYRPVPARPTLEAGLAAARQSIVIRELGAIALVLAVGAVLFWPIRGELDGPFPIVPVTVVLGLMVADLGWQFVDSVRTGLFQVGGATGDHLQESLTESTLSEVQGIARHLRRRLGLITIVAFVLTKITELLDIWDVILEVVSWTPFA